VKAAISFQEPLEVPCLVQDDHHVRHADNPDLAKGVNIFLKSGASSSGLPCTILMTVSTTSVLPNLSSSRKHARNPHRIDLDVSGPEDERAPGLRSKMCF